MDGRSATLAALGVAIAGIVAFFVLEGVTAGLVLFVAGVVLVVIGIFGWQDRSPVLAAAAGAGASVVEQPSDAGSAATDSAAADDLEAGGLDEPEGAVDRAGWSDEEAPVPDATPGADAAAERLDGADDDAVLDAGGNTWRDAGAAEPADRARAPMMQVVDGADTVDHVHDQPLHGHSDLVAHARDYHPELPTDGSTIQLRLLHERAHGAPHEIPPTLRPS